MGKTGDWLQGDAKLSDVLILMGLIAEPAATLEVSDYQADYARFQTAFTLTITAVSNVFREDFQIKQDVSNRPPKLRFA